MHISLLERNTGGPQMCVHQVMSVKINFPVCYVEVSDLRHILAASAVIDNRIPHDRSRSNFV